MLHRFRRPDGSLELARHLYVERVEHARDASRAAVSGWAGKVKFIGFDASDTLVKGLSDGHIDALVVQDPVKMGYLGVKTMVDHLQGRPVEKRIDTGAQLVTRDRMADPAVKELLQPDLSVLANPASANRRRLAHNSRCAACARRSAAPSRSTVSTSLCAAAKCARSSGRTAPARAR